MIARIIRWFALAWFDLYIIRQRIREMQHGEAEQRQMRKRKAIIDRGGIACFTHNRVVYGY